MRAVVSVADADTILRYLKDPAIDLVHAYAPTMDPLVADVCDGKVVHHAAVLGPDHGEAWWREGTRTWTLDPPPTMFAPGWHTVEVRTLRQALLALGGPARVHLLGPYALATLCALPSWHHGRVAQAVVQP